MSLETLIDNFQKKNENAFEELYKMYGDSIYGVVFNIVKKHEIAQDLTQDVFLKAWNNAHSYSSDKGRFFTWILNIARNAAIDKVRSKDFKNSLKNLDVDFFVSTIQSNESLDNKTDALGIKKFVSKLAKKCVEVIELLYFKGFTQKEASEALEMPIGTIKTRNRNCIKELRVMLDIN